MPDITAATRAKLSDDVLFQELQGDAVLLELKTGVYFGLDRVGTRIWQLLAEHETVSDVVAAMIREYDVPEARCEEDVRVLVARLLDQGLLAIV